MRIFQKGFNFGEDGPGNRLVYHLQGCNMHCPWCSNPEGMGAGGGTEVSVDELLDECIRSRMLFFSGGGVTFTGGEATVQYDELFSLLSRLREAGIHTAIETNGTSARLGELLSEVDYLMMDFKHFDDGRLRAVTGVGNAVIKQNYEQNCLRGRQQHIRIPLIGGFNASEADAKQFADQFRALGLPGHGTVELLPYHEYGKEKYAACGLPYTMTSDAKITPEMLRTFTDILTDAGITLIKT